MSRQKNKIVAGNWKMNLDQAGAAALVKEVNALIGSLPSDVTLVFCPSFVHLSAVKALLPAQANIALGAQNCALKSSGAYTGEVSAPMLASYGVSYVILGHSERRQYFKETNAELAAKTDLALANGLRPIFCVGEVLDERNAGKHVEVVRQQLEEGLFHLDAAQFGQVVIAYEPVWAIGTGVTATSAQAQEMHAAIRAMLAGRYGQEAADQTTILYGGSCNAANAAELFACADVDGGLIGGASLKAADFVTIAKSY